MRSRNARSTSIACRNGPSRSFTSDNGNSFACAFTIGATSAAPHATRPSATKASAASNTMTPATRNFVSYETKFRRTVGQFFVAPATRSCSEGLVASVRIVSVRVEITAANSGVHVKQVFGHFEIVRAQALQLQRLHLGGRGNELKSARRG